MEEIEAFVKKVKNKEEAVKVVKKLLRREAANVRINVEKRLPQLIRVGEDTRPGAAYTRVDRTILIVPSSSRVSLVKREEIYDYPYTNATWYYVALVGAQWAVHMHRHSDDYEGQLRREMHNTIYSDEDEDAFKELKELAKMYDP